MNYLIQNTGTPNVNKHRPFAVRADLPRQSFAPAEKYCPRINFENDPGTEYIFFSNRTQPSSITIQNATCTGSSLTLRFDWKLLRTINSAATAPTPPIEYFRKFGFRWCFIYGDVVVWKRKVPMRKSR